MHRRIPPPSEPHQATRKKSGPRNKKMIDDENQKHPATSDTELTHLLSPHVSGNAAEVMRRTARVIVSANGDSNPDHQEACYEVGRANNIF